jgi:signal transduction histidine kinase
MFHFSKQCADPGMSLVRLSDTWRTTTFRLVLLYGTMFSFGVVGILALIYYDTKNYIDRQTEHILRAELHSYLATPVQYLPKSFSEDINRDSRNIEIYGLFSPNDQLLAGNAIRLPADMPIDGTPHLIQTKSSGIWITNTTDIWGVATKLPDQNILFLGRRLIQLDEIRLIIFKALAGAVFVILIGTALGIGLSLRPIRRIRAIQEVSQRIIQGDIGLRLPLAGSNDELDLLAQIVNKMLDEIAQRMGDIKGAADSVAHDLRTPLTHLRTKLNRLLHSTNDCVDRQIVEQAVEEADILLFRFRALLRISEISGSLRRAMFEDVDLKPIMENIQDIYAPLAEEKNVVLNFGLPDEISTVIGDSALLFEALMNLVDNAVKFAPPGGHVNVKLIAATHAPKIIIENDGTGIPPEELNLVLLPFYRSEMNRHLSVGHGVGLSIVSAIANLHGFHLSLSSSDGITRATLDCADPK